jgi:hypothetical protein
LILGKCRQLDYLHAFLLVGLNRQESVCFGNVALQFDVVLEVLLHFLKGDNRLPVRV